jgi:hypothetical protein
MSDDGQAARCAHTDAGLRCRSIIIGLLRYNVNQSRLRVVFDVVPSGFVLVDARGTVRWRTGKHSVCCQV